MLDWLLVAVSLTHLLVCPFGKVEEHFNLNAMHDILYHQTNLEKYHHLGFPDEVMRTFIGPLIVSSLASPFVALAHLLGYSKIVSLYIVRFTMGALVLWSFVKLRNRITKSFGKGTSDWFVLITASQFHFIFYLSRPLANTFALVLVLLAYYYLLGKEHCVSCSDYHLSNRSCNITGIYPLKRNLDRTSYYSNGFKYCRTFWTVISESKSWSTPYFGSVLRGLRQLSYDTMSSKTKATFATSPFLWYFYSAIPRALGTSLAFVPLGLIFERRDLPLVIPPLLFVLAYSFLPHKELRFIIYTFPLFNIAATTFCSPL